jgi:anti-sigma factor RsiW
MRCPDFLERYSDFRDGRLTDRFWLQQMQQHLKACANCQRLHAAIREGVGILRALEPVEPTPAFRRALRARLAAASSPTELRGALAPGAIAVATLLAVAATLLIYEGLARPRRPSLARSRQSLPVVIVNPSVPFVGFAAAGGGQQGPAVRWASSDSEAIAP